MLTPLDFLSDLTNPLLSFLPKALLISVLSAIVCAVVGCHVVLRGMTFIGDAVAHAVFPGIALAFVLQGSLLLGGLAAGAVTAVLIAVLGTSRRLRADSIIGVLMVGMFAAGIVIMSRAPGYSGSLTSFLFGSITGIPDSSVVVVAIGSLLVLGILMLLHRDLVAVGLDRGYAQALGLPVLLLDIALSVLVTMAVVMSIQTIGNILVIALLVTPAAAARMLTDRLVPMMLTAAGIGCGSAVLGIYLSWALDLPTGGVIVLVCTAVFAAAWALGPRHGVLRRSVGRAPVSAPAA
ncbi:anchored repeat-type ABC transporter permease subunit [Helcobacillus massiliensis]|uniref:anchored repeat-type ABC transporter permease subunit n=1 Tax=Helcobacillus massiliensis TaxID=521392 RepID=UPI0021A51A11|nr:anchored repeat-type ABC transporter permease subunit [Helcobacillus massiliensis]MCT1558100.1 anchored repeat-type ABC transporter permease subunit [Helcobacillus massiliensis]MCT2036601.1 anchored repeat-type ABC transporter permease subunit [Helcobacillus massiliensis]MCT2332525.1 anchored repeat-type ABC transporter permease subunit [Helcobacillus massiliensis]